MAGDTRARMVRATQVLMASHGSHGTSFTDVLAASGAPRGSLYHHFPGGKDELVRSAVEVAGANALAALEASRGRPAPDVAAGFIDAWRRLLVATDFTVGCAVAAVTVDAETSELVERGGEVFRQWTATLCELLTVGGVPEARAGALAALLIAGCEGAVIMSRAERDLAPFEQTATELLRLIATATAG
ncbi:TetR/AcrR family transcriptional regulator [Agromyces sp. NPDC057865]|uniref:TetR/AcrR family transcriptional regulator n=1 Tax=Agromyces sp. NPDC057865 TaxID=3346267 RepID=UPI00366ED092